jgi:hypothetical protein
MYYATEQIDALEDGCKLTKISVSQNYCLADVSIFDWHQYVLEFWEVGWLASMADLLPVPNLLMEPKGISSHFILFTHS